MKKIIVSICALVGAWLLHLLWHVAAGAGIVALWNEVIAEWLNLPSLSAWYGIVACSVLCVPVLLGVGHWHGKKKQKQHCEERHGHICHCDNDQQKKDKERLD